MAIDRILIDSRPGLGRAALLDGERLVELRVERPGRESRVGAVYLGRLRKVAKGLQAAFVDIGLERDGFLPLSDGLSEGDALAVRVVRDPEGEKGAKLAQVPGDATGLRPPLCLRPAPSLAERLRLDFPEAALSEEAFGEELEDAVAAALVPYVPLPSGGSLAIEETAALVAIDVNAGPGAGGGREASHLAVNREAAAEVARQIRLRNLAGSLVVDFLRMKRDEGRRKVLTALREAVATDPAGVQVRGFTALGLVEMVRTKSGESLSRLLTVPCAACGGAGRIPSPDRIAADILAALEREARARPGGTLRLLAAPSALAALPETGNRFGHPVVLEARADFPADTFHILVAP
ncbi:MAG: ribonuclease E/G [Magnetospirillum sp. WYHS-4]